jgi:arsenite oxidase small subunit
MSDRPPRWRSDFPIRWDGDHYVTRRELAKFLALGSALLVGANALLAFLGRRVRPAPPEREVAGAAQLEPGRSLLFRYPTEDDPCILLRTTDGQLLAYSQVCTHLSCAVVHQPAEDTLFCPCHRGAFSCSEGRPTAGPPTRRLPRIRLVHRGPAVYATGVEL